MPLAMFLADCKIETCLMEAFKRSIKQPSMTSLWKRINAVVSIGKDLLFQIFFAKTLRQAPHGLVLLCLSIVDLSLLHYFVLQHATVDLSPPHYFVLQPASGTHGAGESQTH